MYMHVDDELSLSEALKMLQPAMESKWRELGIHLKLSVGKLDSFESDHKTVSRCLTEVLTHWSRNQKASWNELADAVRDVGGYSNVEKEIRAKCKNNEQDSGFEGSSVRSSDSELDIFDVTSLSPGCGCGECDVYKMCTKGCPQPNFSKHLPILTKYAGGETAAESATKRLVSPAISEKIDFEKKTSEISTKFGKLVFETSKSLERTVTKEGLVLYLINAFPILKSRTDELCSAKNMHDVFTIVTSQACSWFSFTIIEHMIKEFGSEDQSDERRLADYKQHFERFARQSLPPGMTHFETGSKAGMTGCKKLVMKVKKEWETTTVAELDRICGEFARILEIDRKNLYLADVKKGCIMLTMMIPQEIAQKLVEKRLTKAKKEMLKNENVVRLVCGRFKWSASSTSKKQQTRLISDSESDKEEVNINESVYLLFILSCIIMYMTSI